MKGYLDRLRAFYPPRGHKASHQDGGADEISVEGLTGVLATPQDPAAHTQAISTIIGLQTELNSKEDEVNKGVANGYASLGADGLVPGSQLPAGSGAAWGAITGTLSAQTDLVVALAGKLDLGFAELLANKNQPSGYAGLSAASKLTGSQQVYGTGANTAAEGNDARLSDARTPTAHATSHKSGGSDVVKLDELGAPTDTTTLDATVTKHGLLPKLSGSSSDFLNGTGFWGMPLPGAPTNATYIVQTDNLGLSAEQILADLATGLLKVTTTTGVLSTAVANTDYAAAAHAARHQNGGADEISVAGLSGLLADGQTPLTHNILTAHNGFPGGTTDFLRADGAFAAPAGGPPSAHATSHQNAGSDEISVAGLSGLLADGQTPLAHNILTAHNGFPGGTSTFLRADGAFAAPPAGGPGATWTEFTQNLGAARRSGVFVLTGLSGLTAGDIKEVVQTSAPIATKGNATDEPELDMIILTGRAVDATSIAVTWFAPSTVVGTYAFAWK